MIELGQLEAQHEEFAKRKTRVIVASVEDQKTAQETQKDFPHLVVIADEERTLAQALALIHPGSAPDGGDTAAPTTIVTDGHGVVRWIYRADNVFRRLSPQEVVAAVDANLPRN